MLLNLTDLSDEPLQSQISRQIRAKVLAGDLAAGEALPSIRALARDARVSVITVQRGYEDLEREGLIHSRRGKGFFVSELRPDRKKDMARRRLKDQIQPIVKAAVAEGLSTDEIMATVVGIVTKRA
jgi:DNA-binding transcriptional regulator YhcF (GntR family)